MGSVQYGLIPGNSRCFATYKAIERVTCDVSTC
jgi:hypothetical protein